VNIVNALQGSSQENGKPDGVLGMFCGLFAFL